MFVARKVLGHTMAGGNICVWLPPAAVLNHLARSLAEEVGLAEGVGHERVFVTFANGVPMTPFGHRRPLSDFL